MNEQETNGTEYSSQTRVFTLKELSQYDGKDGI